MLKDVATKSKLNASHWLRFSGVLVKVDEALPAVTWILTGAKSYRGSVPKSREIRYRVPIEVEMVWVRPAYGALS